MVLGVVMLLVAAFGAGWFAHRSNPATRVPVPGVPGKQYGAAEYILRADGFKYRIETTGHNTGVNPRPLHSVISERPGVGALVQPGTTITLVVEGAINA